MCQHKCYNESGYKILAKKPHTKKCVYIVNLQIAPLVKWSILSILSIENFTITMVKNYLGWYRVSQ